MIYHDIFPLSALPHATLDVHKRPVWLKALAGVGEGFPESPHVNPMHADAASLSRLFRPAVVQVS